MVWPSSGTGAWRWTVAFTALPRALAAPSALPPQRVAAEPVDRGLHPYHFELSIDPPSSTSVASGTFADELNITGWGILNVETNSAYTDLQQAYAAGLVEGYLTAHHIYTTQANFFSILFGENATGIEQVPPKVIEFMDRQEAWTRVQVSAQAAWDPFWAQAGNVLAQLDGLVAGYAVAVHHGSVPALDRFSFQMLSAAGDLSDIIPGVSKHRRIDWDALSPPEATDLHARLGRCTAMVKVTPDFSDIFIGHSTWQDYSNTNRIFKHYHFNFSNPTTASRRVSFSGYPGILASQDDFYLMSSGLGMIQTSNVIVAQAQFDAIVPESLLAWQRVRIAGVMARSAPEWYEHFSRHHSGTYANQYMIIDFNRFIPKHELQSDLLWVIEETPGLVVGTDVSTTFSRGGYWPSYNVPFHADIAWKSGYQQASYRHGNYFTYQLCPRAQIFRRDVGAVTELERVKAFLRYNNYLHDEFSVDTLGLPNPTWAVCARGDLHKRNAQASGCYDTKVTSFLLGAMEGHAHAINGPTRSLGRGDLPAFTWADDRFASKRHLGVPNTYDFDFIHTAPGPRSGFPSRPGISASSPRVGGPVTAAALYM